MMHKLSFGAGAAVGYFFGAKAGRQRYDEINRTLAKLRRSPKVEAATDRAKTVLDEGVDKAKTLVGDLVGDKVDKAKSVVTKKSNGSPASADGSPHGTNTVPAAAPLANGVPN